jgi:tRNA dimethylallyltransferase
MDKKQVIVIVGPTGVGKTKVAQALAQKLDTEIIQADSRQVYRHMDIGTAKPEAALCHQVRRHLIDIVEPDQYFSAGRYRELAMQLIEDIIARGKLPVVEGGSGLYVRALIDGLFSDPSADNTYRQKLKASAKGQGSNYLHEQLKQLDPLAAKRLHPHDEFRIIRALEIYHNTGKPISHWHTQATSPAKYDFKLYGLTCARPVLYERINRRVDEMLERGLLDEVRRLLSLGYHRELNSMQGLGYRHMLVYLEANGDLALAVSLMKRDTRRYAKRQLTWFRKDARICWLDYSPAEKAMTMAGKIMLNYQLKTGFPKADC